VPTKHLASNGWILPTWNPKKFQPSQLKQLNSKIKILKN